MERFKEKIAIYIAWSLPRRVVLWTVIRAFAHATTGKWGNTHPDEVGYKEVYDRWLEPN
jgi:hypothetical protein